MFSNQAKKRGLPGRGVHNYKSGGWLTADRIETDYCLVLEVPGVVAAAEVDL